MIGGALVALGVSLALTGGWRIYSDLFSTGAREGRRLRGRATRIEACRPGDLVKLVGVVRQLPGTPLLPAPLTGRPCIAWEAGAEELEMHWVSQCQEFLLEVDDGQIARVARVEPKEVVVHCNHGWWSAPDRDAPHAAFLRELDLSAARPRRSFAEGRIDVGTKVAVVGRVRLEADPSAAGPGYRGLGERPVLRAEGGSLVLVSSREEHLR